MTNSGGYVNKSCKGSSSLIRLSVGEDFDDLEDGPQID